MAKTQDMLSAKYDLCKNWRAAMLLPIRTFKSVQMRCSVTKYVCCFNLPGSDSICFSSSAANDDLD
jgi:hypothetical protein